MVFQGRWGGRGRSAVKFSPLLLVAMMASAAYPQAGAQLDGPGTVVEDLMQSHAMRADSRLADVCFVDPQYGWAVGDRGAIWHTEDGGEQWRLQKSGTGHTLESVHFIDRHNGWAVGGYSHPHSHTGSGIVLFTHDGGRHWQLDSTLLLPALKQARFFDAKNGWAVGCPSAMFPTGLFVTDSGGRAWKPVHGEALSGILAADFFAEHTGVAARQDGTALTLRNGSIGLASPADFGLRGLARVKLVPPRFGWLVGDGGLVMMTRDGGSSWQTTQTDLPQGTTGEFDFAALAVRGTKVWIAGSPGTRVFHTPDAGLTWVEADTGQNLPLRGLHFVDDRHGWAVGDLGTILATTDGGQTWKRQHSGGTRAALLGLFAEPNRVPLELFAKLSGDEGYLGMVELIGRSDSDSAAPDEVPIADRIHQAVVAVGGSGARTAWRFPLHRPELLMGSEKILATWDRVNDGRGRDLFQAHLVRQIRLWRPEVIVTHAASPLGNDPLGHLVNQAVLPAVQLAADPTSYPEQITRVGLQPWKVKKVFTASEPGLRGTTNLATAELATRLGRSVAEVAAQPRGLVHDRFNATPETLGFKSVIDHISQSGKRNDFFTGIVLPPGGDARRELLAPSAGGVDFIKRIAQRSRNARAILKHADDQTQQGVGLLAQVGNLTDGLHPDASAQILFQLAQRYFKTGCWSMAAETFEVLTGRYPNHPLTRSATEWLMGYYSSDEAAWRVHGSQRYEVVQASAPALDPAALEDRPGKAASLAKKIAETRPDLFARPSIGFPLAAVDRGRGFPTQAERFYMIMARSTRHDAWWTCARGEQWLAEPKGVPPKPILNCAAAAQKPLLDGRLDDAVWQRAKSAEMQSPDGDDTDWPAVAMLAYDHEFLYLAVRCGKAPDTRYQTTDRPRPRDGDLAKHDRVDFFIDLDRDYTTYYRLSVDHRGWTGEGCWGDPSWNPTWFVAAATEDNEWSAEAAIPFEQLTGRFPNSQAVWSVGIQRTVPGVGFQSWSTPASTSVQPEGFGYLAFE
jgi:photosystem II stability/assembly factor-like uncharacterized protein